MLNIEVIRFEAQDVITTSVAAPVEPVDCDCVVDGRIVCTAATNGPDSRGNHYINGGGACTQKGKHTCGIN